MVDNYSLIMALVQCTCNPTRYGNLGEMRPQSRMSRKWRQCRCALYHLNKTAMLKWEQCKIFSIPSNCLIIVYVSGPWSHSPTRILVELFHVAFGFNGGVFTVCRHFFPLFSSGYHVSFTVTRNVTDITSPLLVWLPATDSSFVPAYLNKLLEYGETIQIAIFPTFYSQQAWCSKCQQKYNTPVIHFVIYNRVQSGIYERLGAFMSSWYNGTFGSGHVRPPLATPTARIMNYITIDYYNTISYTD